MTEVERLRDEVRRRYPEARVSLDVPLDPKSSWWLDVAVPGHKLVIEWRRQEGFGISESESSDYGVGPADNS